MSKVEYRPVPGYSGAYHVGDDGSVWSCKSASKIWKLLKPHIMKRANGVPVSSYVQLSSGKVTRWLVHRLILTVFVGSQPSGMECRHLDGSCLNNRLGNLKWGTHKQNGNDMKNHGSLKGHRNGRVVYSEDDVLEMRKLRRDGLPLQEIAKQFKVPYSSVTCITNGSCWKHLPGAYLCKR